MGKTNEILFSAVSAISARGKVFGFRPKAELARDSVVCDGLVDHLFISFLQADIFR